MTTVVPIADRHAIKTVSFGLEWQEPLQEDLLTLFRALHGKVRDQLPRVTPHEEVQFQFVVGSVQPSRESSARQPRLAGVTFDSVQPNGEQEWSLTIRKGFLAVHCHVYTRWLETWNKARQLLAPFVPVLARERGISVIGLQYVDQFRVICPREEFHADDLFRKNSRFLPPHAFSLDGLWHSHHGFFDTLNEPAAHRRLNNINVDVLEVSDERLIQVATSHRALLDQAAVNSAALLYSDGSGELDHHMLQLHKANKSFLSELLSDDICRRIDLKAGD